MNEFSKYVGLDVHQETIAVAIADTGRGKARYYGEIANKPAALRKLVDKLSRDGEVIAFCYEAGPCGYETYRTLAALGMICEVVAPSLIPRKAGDRVKTDRRDALSLAQLYRAGELTAVWVPDEAQEAMRDLVRARGDMKAMEKTAKQRLSAFLLRQGRSYPTSRSKWTQAHRRWLEQQRFTHPVQQIVFQEYVEAVQQSTTRVKDLEREMERACAEWDLAPIVEALMALRGVARIVAMTVVAELGDISRFDSPRQLMAYLGLVPSEHSSGTSKRRGGITKTGNGHVRRVLIEAAWCYRFPARKTAYLQRRAEKSPAGVQAIAWKAQKRLCGRYRHLIEQGKMGVQAVTAVARELAGFIWAIACEVTGKPSGMATAV